jgi:hypothetical protein
MSDKGSLDASMVESTAIDSFPDDVVVADGWTGDWYAIKHPYNPIKAGSAANPFQLYVRKKVQEASKQIGVLEECELPSQYTPDFKLDGVATSGLKGALADTLSSIADDFHSLKSAIAQKLKRKTG